MTWTEIGKNNLQAAKRFLDEQPRSCASRAYYAAHVVLSEALVQAGYTLVPLRQTPPHQEQARLIGKHLAAKGANAVRELRAMIRRLYQRRLDADYRRTVTIDRSLARESLRDASAFLEMLGVR